MIRRILDIVCGAALAFVGVIVWIAIFGFRKQKIEQGGGNTESAAASHQPSNDQSPGNNLTGSEENQQPASEQQGAGQRTGTGHPKLDRPLSTRADIGLACIAGFAFFCSAAGLWVIYQTSLATGESVVIASDTAQRQLRAYIGFQGGVVQGYKNGGEITFHVIEKNFGATPARHVIATVGTSAQPFPFHGELPTKDAAGRLTTEPSEGVLYPGGESQPPDPKITLSAEQRQQMEHGTLAVFFFGRIEYEDIYRHKHFSIFRYQFGGDVAPTDGPLPFATEGNDFD